MSLDPTAVNTTAVAVTGIGQRPDPASPATPRPEVARMLPAWLLCRALLGGTPKMHDGRTVWLPQHTAEDPRDYEIRLKYAELYNMFARTIQAAVGLVFSNLPSLGEDGSPEIAQHWENIDGAGAHGLTFLRRVFEDVLALGHGVIQVEYPPVAAPDQVLLRDEQSLGLRPYWNYYPADKIVSWRTIREGSRDLLEQIVFEECVIKPDGAFGTKEVTQYRQLWRELTPAGPLIHWGIWEEVGTGARKTWMRTTEGLTLKQTEIPVVWLPVGRVKAPYWTSPPMLDLATTNLAHYRLNADLMNTLRLTAQPMLVRTGYSPKAGEESEFKVGPGRTLDFSNPDGKAAWLELTGNGIAPTQAEIQKLELRASSLGMSFMAQDKRIVETAEAKRLDREAHWATLASAAAALQDAVEQALVFHANYMDLTAPSFTVGSDFELAKVDAPTLLAMSQIVKDGNLSRHTFLNFMDGSNLLSDDFDPDKEEELLLSEHLAVQAGEMATPRPPMPPAPASPAPGAAQPVVPPVQQAV